jgi:aspartate kinase
MIVMKFGGTSVEDAAAIRNITGIIRKEIVREPVVVVSACAGITNQLIRTATRASHGEKEKALEEVAAIESRHKKIAKDLFDGDLLKFVNKRIAAIGGELSALVNGVAVLGELTPRSLDTFASYGEIMSSFIIHHYLESQGMKSIWVDARSFMKTDDRFTAAAVQFDATEQKLKEIVLPKANKGYVVMTQGFIGSTQQGITTTIGRGGSDFSAAIIGALLHAEDIQIWTDVDGILTADPSVVPEAKKSKSCRSTKRRNWRISAPVCSIRKRSSRR